MLKDLVIYQVYPRSFKDSNNDGVGDLSGIIGKLDYFEWLGVNAIWLSPFYTSPMADFGYDIADYCDVDPIFGTLAEFDHLVSALHKRKMKILIDLVINHTSDQHAWFKESRKDKDNPKRDWYVWRDGKSDGSPPNNWLSAFGGPAWEFDPATNQYYLHSFLKGQPDLNWHNPEVRAAIKKVMRFWFMRGVDGFRIDAVYWLGKDTQYRDDPPNPTYNPAHDLPYRALLHTHSKRVASVFSHLKELSEVAKSYRGILITEAYPHKRFEYDDYLHFYEKVDPEVLAPFNFESIFLPWQAAAFKKYIDGFQARLQPNYAPVYAMGNHDTPRLASRIGNDATRTAAMLLTTLPGIPVIYYGEEIGMTNVSIPRKLVQDPFEKNVPGMGEGRDPERTPMQWAPGSLAGFSKSASWLPIGEHARVNVQTETDEKSSLLWLYKKMLALRHASPALRQGTYGRLDGYDSDLFAFTREYGEERLEVVLNFSNTRTISSPIEGQVVISTHHHQGKPPKELSPNEGRIIRVS